MLQISQKLCRALTGRFRSGRQAERSAIASFGNSRVYDTNSRVDWNGSELLFMRLEIVWFWEI